VHGRLRRTGAGMDLHRLKDAPSWEWPESAAKQLLATLRDENAAEAERCLAAELAGDLVVMNDDLAAALINILENGGQPSEIRGRAAISLGPVLEQVDTDGFESIESVPIPQTGGRCETSDTDLEVAESSRALSV
jgi:hypothetical protein